MLEVIVYIVMILLFAAAVALVIYGVHLLSVLL